MLLILRHESTVRIRSFFGLFNGYITLYSAFHVGLVYVNSNLIPEVLRHFFQTQASSLRPVKVHHYFRLVTLPFRVFPLLTGNIHDAPADDDEIVLPPHFGKANRRRLQQNERSSKLPKQAEAHPDRPEFSWEDLRYINVHGGITERPLKSQIQEDKEDAHGVTGAVRRSGVFCSHGSQ
jgi:hypothetical protein